MKWFAAGCAIVALAGLPMAASAAVVTVSETVDLNDLPSGGGQDIPPFGPAYSVEIAEGDTFDFTVDFVGDQTLTLTGLQSLWAFSYATTPSDVIGTGALSLLDGDGNAFLTSNTKTNQEGEAHFGQFFFDFDFAVLPPSVTFSGVRYVGVLDDYVADGVTTRTYNSPAFFYQAASAVVVGGVPEPAAWALMLAGFGLAGGALRRRRALLAQV